VTREEIRFECYQAAMKLHGILSRPPEVDVIAERFFLFVDGVDWRVRVLKLAILQTHRRAGLDQFLESVKKISDFAEYQAPTPIARGKKITRRR